jgi:hypothetical protein
VFNLWISHFGEERYNFLIMVFYSRVGADFKLLYGSNRNILLACKSIRRRILVEGERTGRGG